MRHDQEQAARRRLLDHFQQGVGAIGVKVVGAVDDHHAPTTLARRLLENMDRSPHVVDADLREMFLGLLVPLAPQQREIAKGQSRYFSRNGMGRIEVEVFRLLRRERGKIGMGGDEARHAPGERRLANALRTTENPGVRQTSRAVGVEKLGLRRLMAEQDMGVARMGSGSETVAFRRRLRADSSRP